MPQWVTQAEAVRLLALQGDRLSQPGLSQYLAGHAEIPREGERIDFEGLAASRATRRARGPSSRPTSDLAETLDLDLELPDTPSDPDAAPPPSSLSARKARADIRSAEANARRAEVLADLAEARAIPREAAEQALRAAALRLQAMLEERRPELLAALHAAPDPRAAERALRGADQLLLASLADALAALARSPHPEPAHPNPA